MESLYAAAAKDRQQPRHKTNSKRRTLAGPNLVCTRILGINHSNTCRRFPSTHNIAPSYKIAGICGEESHATKPPQMSSSTHGLKPGPELHAEMGISISTLTHPVEFPQLSEILRAETSDTKSHSHAQFRTFNSILAIAPALRPTPRVALRAFLEDSRYERE